VKRKNRPENQFRATTSPLVVRHQSTGRLVEGLNLRGTNLESRPCREKGRAGGRARRPARPLAGEPFYQGQNDRRQGVVAYNSRSDPSFTLFVTVSGLLFFCNYLQITESYQCKPNAREVFTRITASISSKVCPAFVPICQNNS
jgi:hypothetical protein